MTKCQSLSTFSSENLSVSDGEEGNTTDHSHSGTPDVVSTNTDERLDDKSDDLLSQGSEIPADPSDLNQLGSDGLSEKEAILQRVKTQLTTNDHNYEVQKKKRYKSTQIQWKTFSDRLSFLYSYCKDSCLGNFINYAHVVILKLKAKLSLFC